MVDQNDIHRNIPAFHCVIKIPQLAFAVAVNFPPRSRFAAQPRRFFLAVSYQRLMCFQYLHFRALQLTVTASRMRSLAPLSSSKLLKAL
jgi:hypothetical protein